MIEPFKPRDALVRGETFRDKFRKIHLDILISILPDSRLSSLNYF